MAVVLPTFAKTNSWKQSRSGIKHCDGSGATFSSLFKKNAGGSLLWTIINLRCASVAKWATRRLMKEKKKRYCRAPLCCIGTASCSLAMTEGPSEGMWSSPVTECIYWPCDTHLSMTELKGEGEMVHSKWIAILPVTARDPGSSIPALLCGCTVTVLPQSLLGWPTFFFYCKGCAHLLTFPPPFLLPSPPRETSCPDASLTWVSRRAALVWCPLPSLGLN